MKRKNITPRSFFFWLEMKEMQLNFWSRVCMPIRPHVSASKLFNGLQWNMMLVGYFKCCQREIFCWCVPAQYDPSSSRLKTRTELHRNYWQTVHLFVTINNICKYYNIRHWSCSDMQFCFVYFSIWLLQNKYVKWYFFF